MIVPEREDYTLCGPSVNYFGYIMKTPRGGREPAFLTRVRSEVVETGVDTRRATEGPGGVVETTSRSPTERNAVDMPVSAAAVEAW
jgi:hypothetical protein